MYCRPSSTTAHMPPHRFCLPPPALCGHSPAHFSIAFVPYCATVPARLSLSLLDHSHLFCNRAPKMQGPHLLQSMKMISKLRSFIPNCCLEGIGPNNERRCSSLENSWNSSSSRDQSIMPKRQRKADAAGNCEHRTQRIHMGPRSKHERKWRRNSLREGRTNAVAGPRNDQLFRQRDSNSS